MDDLVVVEHIDDGTLTLHKGTCAHAQRAIITHLATPFWLTALDRVCGTCKPEHTGPLQEHVPLCPCAQCTTVMQA